MSLRKDKNNSLITLFGWCCGVVVLLPYDLTLWNNVMRFNDDAFAVEQQCYCRIKCRTLLHCFPVVCVTEILMTCNTISF